MNADRLWKVHCSIKYYDILKLNICECSLSHCYPFELEFETKLLFRRIDRKIEVTSNVDPTFYSLVGSGGPEGGDTTVFLFSRIHTSLIGFWAAIRTQV